MEHAPESLQKSDNFARDLAILEWLVELGADEAISEAGINRYDMQAVVSKPAPQIAGAAPKTLTIDTQTIAARCADLDDLRAAIEDFEGCNLKQGARNTVFCDGNPAARIMIIGEAPGREEDRIGRPFIGPAGQLLDLMFGAINLSRRAEQTKDAIYITNVMPWRPPQNRNPSLDEITMMKPFLLRHIELAKPEFLVLMGNPATKTLLDTTAGITKMRGQWGQVLGIPALPMFHPAYLLRTPIQKRTAWADLLSLQARLENG